MKNKTLILSLIKDDIINSKLVYGLNALGLNASDYLLHLSETVFQLMKIKEDEHYDTLYENYLELLKKAKAIDLSKAHVLDQLALKIYNELALYKNNKLVVYKNS